MRPGQDLSGKRREAGSNARHLGATLRIALIKLSSLGDVVHALPVAHALRARWPRGELTWIVERREEAILAGNPTLDHVVSVDTRLWREEFRRPTGAHAVFVKLRGLVRRLGMGRFDIALDLQGLWKSGVITRLTRAPLRIGLAMRHCRERANVLFTNHRVVLPPDAVHVVEENLALLGPLGLRPDTAGKPTFPIAGDRTAEQVVSRYLEEEGLKPETPLVALNRDLVTEVFPRRDPPRLTIDVDGSVRCSQRSYDSSRAAGERGVRYRRGSRTVLARTAASVSSPA